MLKFIFEGVERPLTTLAAIIGGLGGLAAESKFEFVYVVEVAVLEVGGGGCRATGIAFLGTVCATMFEYDMGLPGAGAAATRVAITDAAAGVGAFRAKSSCVICFLLFSFELFTELAGCWYRGGIWTVCAVCCGSSWIAMRIKPQ